MHVPWYIQLHILYKVVKKWKQIVNREYLLSTVALPLIASKVLKLYCQLYPV